MVKAEKYITTVFVVDDMKYLDREAALTSYKTARMREFWRESGTNTMDREDATNICLKRADALMAILNERSPFEQE